MQIILISIIFVLMGVSAAIVTYFIPYRARRKNILVPVQSLLQIIFFLIPGVVSFGILFLLTKSVWRSLLFVVIAYVLVFLMEYSILRSRILPTPRRKWFYEISLQSIMKTTETYPVKVILKPAIVEFDYGGRRTERVLQHIPVSFEEEPIAETSEKGRLDGELWIQTKSQSEEGYSIDARGQRIVASLDASTALNVQVNAPAFGIDPKELSVTLGRKPTSVEFLVTPSKSGKHLLAVEFRDKSGRRGYLKTTIHVKDYIFFKFIMLTEMQIKVVRSIGYIIGIVGIIVGILHTVA